MSDDACNVDPLVAGQALLEQRRNELRRQRAVEAAQEGQPRPEHEGDDLRDPAGASLQTVPSYSYAAGGYNAMLPAAASPEPKSAVNTPNLSTAASLGAALETVASGREWGSAAVTVVLRRTLEVREGAQENAAGELRTMLDEACRRLERAGEVVAAGDSGPDSCQSMSPDGQRHYTKLGLAALQAEEVTLYRVWLFVRYLDPAGSGWCDLQELRTVATADGSDLRCFSWRRLRQILNEGEGRYWTRETGRDGFVRVRYANPASLANELKAEDLSGAPVIVPAEILAASIGEFKQFLVKAFHRSRQDPETGAGAPISRATLEEMTGLSERTLRRYEDAGDIEVIHNYEVIGAYSRAAVEEAAWRHGEAVFVITDNAGRHGPVGEQLIVRQLPNSYRVAEGDVETAARGRQRKIRKERRNACDNGAQANSDSAFLKLFHLSAEAAARSFSRHSRPVTWRGGITRSGAGLYYGIGAPTRGVDAE